jgi:hypothetical protein
MRDRYVRWVLVGVAAIVIGMSGVAAQPKGETVTVTGEAVDMWCYLEAGDRGAAKKACATACAKAGNPIAIVDAGGNLYVAAGLKSHRPAHALLLDKMNEQVTVSGTLVEKNDLKMLYIESVR